jgi:tetratricopeptide (TPR) repeat protein
MTRPIAARRAVFVSVLLTPLAAGCTLFSSPHERGERHLQRGDYLRAVEAYSEAIEQGDFVAVAYANRCYANEARGDFGAALHDCTEALNLMGEPDPSDPVALVEWTEVLNNRGVTYIGLRRYDDAIADLERAIALRPDYAEAYANLGRTHLENEDYDDALVALERAVELNRGLAEAWGNKAQALTGKDDVDGALEAFGTAIEVSGGNPDIYFNRASLLYATGHFMEALADYRVVAERSTNEQLAFMAQQQALFLSNAEPKDGTGTPPAGAATSESGDESGTTTPDDPDADPSPTPTPED